MTKEEILKLSPEEQAFIADNHLEGLTHEEINGIAEHYDLLVWQGVL